PNLRSYTGSQSIHGMERTQVGDKWIDQSTALERIDERNRNPKTRLSARPGVSGSSGVYHMESIQPSDSVGPVRHMLDHATDLEKGAGVPDKISETNGQVCRDCGHYVTSRFECEEHWRLTKHAYYVPFKRI